MSGLLMSDIAYAWALNRQAGVRSRRCDSVSRVTGESAGPCEAARSSYQCGSANVVGWKIESIPPRKSN